MLAVKNNTKMPFVGRFDGIDYPFPPGEEVMITKDAARHIFGLGEADKTAVLVRHGWMKGSHDRDAAMSILNGFSFSQTKLVTSSDVPEVEPEIEAEQEHESSPHAEGEGGEAVSDGAEEPPEPTSNPENKGGGMLGRLGMGKKQ